MTIAALIGMPVCVAILAFLSLPLWSEPLARRRTIRNQAKTAPSPWAERTLHSMPQGVAVYDAGGVLRMVNPTFADLYSIPFAAIEPGLRYERVLSMTGLAASRNEGNLPGLRAPELRALSDGRIIAVRHQDLEGGAWLELHDDVTIQQEHARNAAYLAWHDTLTGLPNRMLFGERLQQAIAKLDRDLPFAVFCLDLDRFKSVNDTLGHPVGDALLKAASDRFAACLRQGDTVARLGGDEFAIIQQHSRAPEDAETLARRIIAALDEPFHIDGHRILSRTSIGIALAPHDGSERDQLLLHADMALYRAKANGRGGYSFFEPDMGARMKSRRTLEIDLRQALECDALEIEYLPAFDLASRRITGFEALLRWNHPSRGPIPPMDLIRLAEESGLVNRLGEWILQRACRDATFWPADVQVAVNLSPIQFQSPHFTDALRRVLAATKLPPGRLELEITEAVLLQESETAAGNMHAARTLGVHLTLDDFGTGYSPLTHLKRFPFSAMKIDGSFVHEAARDANTGSILRAVINLGAELGIRVTAEGVENEAELAMLQAAGCVQAQGFYLGKPVAAEQVLQNALCLT